MPNVYFYYLAMSAVVFLLWQAIHRSAPTPFWRLLGLSVLGAGAAGALGMGDGRLISGGLAWCGSVFLFGMAFLLSRQEINGKRRLLLPRLIVCGTAVYLIACVDALLIEPTAVQVKRLTITTEKITRPMRILFMADFQADSIGPYERHTLRLVKEQKADLILWGGDYLQVRGEEAERKLLIETNDLLREVDLDAPLGVYAVMGNQEIGRMYDWTRLFHGTKIVPAVKTVSLDAGEVRVTLLEMYASFTPRKYYDRHRDGRFRIMLGHCPSYAMREQDADLLLAGHTHGGQLWIPGFGPLVTMSPGLPRRWARGVTRLSNGSILLISTGTGMERGTAPRIRFNCRPDMWVIDLVPAKNNFPKKHLPIP